MAMKIPISFKRSEKDMYDYLMQQLSPSIFVKQLIKKEMEKEPPRKINKDPFNF